MYMAVCDMISFPRITPQIQPFVLQSTNVDKWIEKTISESSLGLWCSASLLLPKSLIFLFIHFTS